jgi:hypothetical protein
MALSKNLSSVWGRLGPPITSVAQPHTPRHYALRIKIRGKRLRRLDRRLKNDRLSYKSAPQCPNPRGDFVAWTGHAKR